MGATDLSIAPYCGYKQSSTADRDVNYVDTLRNSKIEHDSHMRIKTHKKKKYYPRGEEASEEELRIWNELEEEVERTLEEEIKDQIYHLALRLSRLYQHQMERITNNATKEKAFSEVNIRIIMQGGTKVEIKETKKLVSDSSRELTRVRGQAAPRSEKVVALPPRPQSKKVDWVKSLRSRYNHSSLISPGSSGGIDLC